MTNLLGLATLFLLGMRHGVDHDHIAAIGDLSGLGATPRRAMILGVLYAAGHALVLFAFSVLVVSVGLHLPEGVEQWRERIVGATLVVLGGMVLWQLVRPGAHGHSVSRGMIIVRALDRLLKRVGVQRTVSSGTAAFLVGMIHGVGAETPSQMLVLVLAAGLGGGQAYVAVTTFVAGLFVSNTIICGAAVGLFRRATGRGRFLRALTGAVAAYSVVVGLFFLFG